MTDPNVRPAPDALQFDRATATGQQQEPSDVTGVACSRCKDVIKTYYYHLDGATVCASCKQAVVQAGATQKSSGAFLRAGMFGFGAAVAGAAIYYGVIAITNLEIGIVAILIGYMVGSAIRKGARGAGGRRYQVLAIGLTYFSVGLAYSPLAFKGIMERRTNEAAASRRRPDSAAAGATHEETRSADTTPVQRRSDAALPTSISVADSTEAAHLTGGQAFMALGLALGATFLLIFALPVLMVMGSMPSGLISALIIAIGMRQAWRMTEGHVFKVTGPYKVGGAAAESA